MKYTKSMSACVLSQLGFLEKAQHGQHAGPSTKYKFGMSHAIAPRSPFFQDKRTEYIHVAWRDEQ